MHKTIDIALTIMLKHCACPAITHFTIFPNSEMVSLSAFAVAVACALSARSSFAKLTWKDTKYMFVFGDSYTAEGYNVSAGVNSPTPGWVPYLATTFVVLDNLSHVVIFRHHPMDPTGLVISGLPTMLPTRRSSISRMVERP
jgi:hypothetical protein